MELIFRIIEIIIFDNLEYFHPNSYNAMQNNHFFINVMLEK